MRSREVSEASGAKVLLPADPWWSDHERGPFMTNRGVVTSPIIRPLNRVLRDAWGRHARIWALVRRPAGCDRSGTSHRSRPRLGGLHRARAAPNQRRYVALRASVLRHGSVVAAF